MAALLLLIPLSAAAQEALGKKAAEKELAAIAGGYRNWTTASWQAKVKADGLFISPAMKVFMERGKRTSISVRVPIMGEVMRMEINNDSVLVANKMKRVYWSMPMNVAKNMLPDFLNESQSLMLGRIAVLGSGEISKQSASEVQVFEIPVGGYLIMPQPSSEFSFASYGYAVDAQNRLSALMVRSGKPATANRNGSNSGDDAEQSSADDDASAASSAPANSQSYSLVVEVTYKTAEATKGANVALALESPRMSMAASLDVDAIQWDVAGFEPLTSIKNYRRATSPNECFKF